MSSEDRASLLNALHTAWKELRLDGRRRDELRLVAVMSKPRSLTPQQAFESARERSQSAIAGWVRHQSAKYAFAHDKPEIFRDARESSPRWDNVHEFGPPIAGEWVMDEKRSVHLRGNPAVPGMLTEWTYTERALMNGRTADDEIPALSQEVLALMPPLPDSPPDDGRLPVLLYRVYWGIASDDDPSALRRLFARFAGFAVRDCVRHPVRRGARLSTA